MVRVSVRWFRARLGAARRALEAAGFRAAFTIVPSFWSSDRDRYLVGRDSLSVEADERAWATALRGGYDPIGWVKERRRRGRLSP